MTRDKLDVQALIGKTGEGNFLRKMIGFVAQRLMETEVGECTGAAYGEKDPERVAQRNGAVTGTGRRGPARRSRGYQSCAKAPTFRGFWNRAGWRRRH